MVKRLLKLFFVVNIRIFSSVMSSMCAEREDGNPKSYSVRNGVFHMGIHRDSLYAYGVARPLRC